MQSVHAHDRGVQTGWSLRSFPTKTLYDSKVLLCCRKPGVWANIVAAFLSLLLKSLSHFSSSQFNYCNPLFTVAANFAFPLAICTIRWNLTELYFTSTSFLLFCLSPDYSVPMFLHIFRDAQCFFHALSSFCFVTSFVLLCTTGWLRQKGWDRAHLLHSLAGELFILGNLFY